MEWPLSAVEFDVLWREAGFGEPPYPLELESPGTSDDERASIVAAALAGLAARGLAHDGVPSAAVVGALELLAGADTVIDGRLAFGEQVRLVATRLGDRAALVLQRGEELRLRALDGARLGSALVELLPPTAPAHGQSVRLSHQVFVAALADLAGGGSLWDFERALRSDGVRGHDVRWLAGIAGARGGSGAQLGTSVRGRRTGLLSWHVTPLGGVLIQRHEGADWITVAPSDPGKAVAQLEGLTAAR